MLRSLLAVGLAALTVGLFTRFHADQDFRTAATTPAARSEGT